ncbi:MAG: hypothetical protein GU354_06980 [Caldimicrobium sp.]|jgi:hypothetical protein|nr:hypothetical protein [Caldimicrobium sp.]
MKLPSRDIVFYLESSLRGLAKWLRFLGYKAEIAQHRIDLKTILENREKFFLITSEETARVLEKAGADFLLLPRDNLKAQIKRLLNKLNLDPELKLDICTICGVDLIPVNKEDYKEKIPPKAYELYNEFNLCPSCGRVYWEGDHVQRIKEKWKELTS